jgi:hypothetical protein
VIQVYIICFDRFFHNAHPSYFQRTEFETALHKYTLAPANRERELVAVSARERHELVRAELVQVGNAFVNHPLL